MVANPPKGPLDAAKNGLAAMLNARKLAVDGYWRPHDLPAKDLAQRLVAKTNAKDWNCLGRGRNEIETNPGMPGRARARREHNRIRGRFHDCGHAYAIVTVNGDSGARPAEAMDQVPGETVVIVNERYGCHARFALPLRALLVPPSRKVKVNAFRISFSGARGSRLPQFSLASPRRVTSFMLKRVYSDRVIGFNRNLPRDGSNMTFDPFLSRRDVMTAAAALAAVAPARRLLAKDQPLPAPERGTAPGVMVKGTVFESRTGALERQAGDPGLAGIMVSNGR